MVIMKLKPLSAVFTCEALTKQGRVPERRSIQSSILQSLSAFSLQWNWRISGFSVTPFVFDTDEDYTFQWVRTDCTK
jgi:hypothetical protein